MPGAALFELDAIFDEDYLYFYESVLPPERTAREASTIWTLLSLAPGDTVLDLGCGHGRIAHALAQRGARVTGVDRSAAFIAQARQHGAADAARPEFFVGDMREFDRPGAFDAVIIWFTTFGYFDDATNEDVLRRAWRALKPGGRLLIEQSNRYGMIRAGAELRHVTRKGADMLIDLVAYDALTDRQETERLLVRNGVVRVTKYAIRLYGFTELSRLLNGCGAVAVDAFGQSGEPFTLAGRRLIVRATK